tara:strand:- start:4 stop:606 length:603 start_codon:yes stop_codon:yes gene_type:complete
MRQILYIYGFLLIIWSCSSNDRQVEKHTNTVPNDLIDLVRQIPDPVLVSQDKENKEFQLDLTNDKVDISKTKSLFGEWIATMGELKFLNTTLETGDKVVFQDTIGKTVTILGTLVYNRPAKFYFTESASHIYDYYIDHNGLLNLIQLEYRNEDLTLKEQPEPIFERLTINWIGDDQIELTLKDHKVIMKKITTANKGYTK